MKRVLMVAFHYPPQAGSSGVQRTLKFSQYLPQFGWEPTVLTAHPRAYPRVINGWNPNEDVCKVFRAFALDSSRHLAVKGRYLQATALPDRWASWWLGAVPLGLKLARELKFDAIWSTYPIATAHQIAGSLQKRTGIPWMADFRDPMTEPGFPPDPGMHRAASRIESATIARCTRAVFTTPGTRKAYVKNFPMSDPGRFNVIENGHDEEDFSAAFAVNQVARSPEAPFVLLHSGIVYPSERDPTSLFDAIADLRRTGLLSSREFSLVLRASAHEAVLQKMIDDRKIADIVLLKPPIPYQDALAEMLAADGLLILQASNCNDQIPAKLYEYLRASRPILALTDAIGDTAGALRQVGIDSIARLDDCGQIRVALMDFIQQSHGGKEQIAPLDRVKANSRYHRTAELAGLLNEMVEH